MTARTSSRLPKLDSLESDVHVPLLPGTGRTWVDRSGSYLLRRAAMSLLWLVLLAFVTLVTVAVLLAYWHRTRAGFVGVLVSLTAYSLAVLAWTTVATTRHWNEARNPATRRPNRTRPAWAHGFLLPFYLLQQVFIVFSFLTMGLYLYLFVASLLPEPPVERQARLFLLGQLRTD